MVYFESGRWVQNASGIRPPAEKGPGDQAQSVAAKPRMMLFRYDNQSIFLGMSWVCCSAARARSRSAIRCSSHPVLVQGINSWGVPGSCAVAVRVVSTRVLSMPSGWSAKASDSSTRWISAIGVPRAVVPQLMVLEMESSATCRRVCWGAGADPLESGIGTGYLEPFRAINARQLQPD